MPFTPYHLGPGALFKSLGGARFSFMVFGGSQVLMDIEPLIRIIRGDTVLHGYSHTVVGAFFIAVLAGAIGRPISLFALDLMGIAHQRFGWGVSFTTSFLGTFSHIGLDAIMHSDMNPAAPFVRGNGLLGLTSVSNLHLVCLLAAVLAGGIFGIRALINARLSRPS